MKESLIVFPHDCFSLSSKGFDDFPSAVLLRVLLRQAPEPLRCRLSLRCCTSEHDAVRLFVMVRGPQKHR